MKYPSSLPTPIAVNATVAAVSAVLVGAGLGAAWHAYSPLVDPRLARGFGLYVVALEAAFVLAILVYLVRPPRGPDVFKRWAVVAEALHFATWVAAMAVVWLLMPHGTTEMQLVTLLFTTGYMAANALTSIDRPLLGRIRVISVWASLIAGTMIHRVSLWPYLAIYLLSFGLVMLVVVRIVERGIAALREGRAAAEAARDARTRFLAAASHDLGQPVQAARLFVELAERSEDSEARQRAFDNARQAFAGIERLLQQLLDHLRAEDGAVRCRPVVVALQPLIAEVVAQFHPIAARERVSLRFVATRLSAIADPGLLRRALGNLIDNALRHADAGDVLVGVRRRQGFVRVYVIDNGRGVAGDEAERLFEHYRQGREDGGRERGGFGLGLGSARTALSAMNGEAGIDPRWNNGAAFFLELPAPDALTDRA